MRKLLLFSFVLTMLANLYACGLHKDSPAARSEYRERISDFGRDESPLGQRWREAANRALIQPTRIRLPYAEQGALLAYEPDALGFVFEAEAGQELEIELARQAVADAAYDDGRVYIDVFRVLQLASGVEYRQLDNFAIESQFLRLTIDETADYLIRIQPELLVNMLYALTLELAPVLPFPVSGRDVTAVQSFFGDERDAGDRSHEGVDIFAKRLTPVLAVSEGRAVPRQNQLGGNVVWLNTPGISYYYAHLERAAMEEPRRVQVGDVLGYVGNTGNAKSTPPHLHFGIYRWGGGAIDPLPHLRAYRFADRVVPLNEHQARFLRSDADALNVRAAPSREGPVLRQLPRGTIVWAPGQSGDWLRVRGAVGRGWIHSAYQTALAIGNDPSTAERFELIMDSPAHNPKTIGALAPSDPFYSIDKSKAVIVSANSRLLAGWNFN